MRLELQNISKTYPGVRANDGVCLKVAEGEIHAVLGENGAGKSTLMKIIYGVVQPDAGLILWQGEPVRVASPEQARRLGISMVFQHFSLFESLTVAEKRVARSARKIAARASPRASANSVRAMDSKSSPIDRCTRSRSASVSGSKSCVPC